MNEQQLISSNVEIDENRQLDTRQRRPVLHFDGFVLDPNNESLSRDAGNIALKPQVYAALSLLVAEAGRLVTREALIERIWGLRHVDVDGGLNSIIRQVRRALGDSADTPRYLETVPRKGYRFLASVNPVSGDVAPDEYLAMAGQNGDAKKLWLRPLMILSLSFMSMLLIGFLASLGIAFFVIRSVFLDGPNE